MLNAECQLRIPWLKPAGQKVSSDRVGKWRVFLSLGESLADPAHSGVQVAKMPSDI